VHRAQDVPAATAQDLNAAFYLGAHVCNAALAEGALGVDIPTLASTLRLSSQLESS
jgi:hypothetical protein